MGALYIDEKTLDPETGLPALPDGWFWKVTVFQKHSKLNRYKIAVHMPRTMLGIPLPARQNGNYWNLFSTSNVAEAARTAVIYGNSREKDEESLLNREILGSYPPKRV